MGNSRDKGVGSDVAAAIARQKEIVAQEIDQHKDEDVDLEDVSGGWLVSYATDPTPTPTPTPTIGEQT